CLVQLSDVNVFPVEENEWEKNQNIKKWTRLSDLVFRLITSKQGSNVGMELLTNLIMNNLIPPQMSLYRMFFRGYIPLSKEGLKLLSAVLMNYPMPKKLKKEDYLYFEDDDIDLRTQLLNILFPLEVEIENTIANYQEFAVNYPKETANVILLLNIENPLKVKVKKKRDNFKESFPAEQEVLNSLDISEAQLKEISTDVMDRIQIFIREEVKKVTPFQFFSQI
ncbi:hypothetical protein Anas_07111, partial [Armadillidium nasatum]